MASRQWLPEGVGLAGPLCGTPTGATSKLGWCVTLGWAQTYSKLAALGSKESLEPGGPALHPFLSFCLSPSPTLSLSFSPKHTLVRSVPTLLLPFLGLCAGSLVAFPWPRPLFYFSAGQARLLAKGCMQQPAG